MSASRTGTAAHLSVLDGIRGLAILLVIPHNTNLLSSPTAPLAYLFDLISHSGWIGVQLFFVLSGFLITGNLLALKDEPRYYQIFWCRRVLRIFPLYYATLLVAFVVLPMLIPMNDLLHGTMHNQPWLWLFVSNWTAPFGGEIYAFTHFWSLAVEEQFYFLWPLLVKTLTSRSLFKLSLVLAVVALLIRCIFLAAGGNDMTVYMFTFCRMDALALGAAAAVVFRDQTYRAWLAQRAKLLGWSALGLLLIGFLATHGYERDQLMTQTLGQSCLALAFAVLIVTSASETKNSNNLLVKLLSNRALVSMGKYSYAMYIFHFPLHMLLTRPWFEAHELNQLYDQQLCIGYSLFILCLSYVLAFASFHLFEKHFLKLKRYFSSTAAAAPIATPAS